ncbi:GbsR/MarR family transcriptional regulator [Robertkochia solimangrovi]|uniref:GbsR/MarR family transcriptional regulator n=1 Tax=Robertkochia solimangrovi TaxID=2213046 RepID=UPI00118048CD|nr:helix-turn-helix domain-containing protein [Robertkochia solimangrovi]TRZ45866.1 transcriptional regulator [Robertkochia solimangrovi]
MSELSSEHIEKRRKDLVEQLGVFIEMKDDLPPMAGRILAHLIMESEHGVTFDELVETLQASKSTISTNLNLLVKLNRIDYYTKSGERKRYYRITPFHFRERIEMLLENWQKEREIHIKLMEFKLACNAKLVNNGDDKAYDCRIHTGYLNFLDGMIKLVEEFQVTLSNTIS